MVLRSCILIFAMAWQPAAGQSAIRDLPNTYGGNTFSIHVAITISPPQGTAVMGLEDLPPAGWPVSNISNGGAVDPQSDKVKWGPFFGTLPASLSYDLAVPASASDAACFTGRVSFDGLDQLTGGDLCIEGPIPAASTWGICILLLSLLSAGTITVRKRLVPAC